MEFNEKLQNLRRQKGITQEELASALFVSRTAVSKWESGRGYPSIDALKSIAEFFSVTIDELLSSDELLTIAEVDNKQKENHFLDLLFGLIDISALMLFWLPFFAERVDGIAKEVALLYIESISSYLKIAYIIVVSLIVLCGILTLAMQNTKILIWNKIKTKASILLNAVGVILFVISLQPYAALFLFVYLIIKASMLIKKK